MLLRCAHHCLDLSMPAVMGILNVTPDSFSDGGRFVDPDRALAHAQMMLEAGARIIDVGGESTRPGAAPVSEQDELRRVIPLVETLARRDVIVSVDTSKAAVMQAALAAGAAMINDVRALREPGALSSAAQGEAAVCLMHMQGEPRTMQHEPQYIDVVAEVRDFLQQRIDACVAAGIARERIVVDPGIGFGKRVQHNLALLAALPELVASQPLLIGVSRKSMFGTLLGRAPEDRMAGGVAVAAAAVLAGAAIVRTHDVAATVDAVKMAAALKNAGYRTGVNDDA